MSWQVLNKQGNDAGTDDGRMAIFEDEFKAENWVRQLLQENGSEELTIRRVTFNVEKALDNPHIRAWCPQTGAVEDFEEECPGNKDLNSVADHFAEEHDLSDGHYVFLKREGQPVERFRVRTETSIHYNTEPV